MNKVILLGRLTRDVEVRYSQGTSTAIARYSLAVKRPFAKQGDVDVDFFNVVSFGKAAEFAEKYFKKGQQVCVVGRLQTNTWEDQQKVKHYSVDIIAEEQHFAESKGGDGRTAQNKPAPAQTTDDEDLPF